VLLGPLGRAKGREAIRALMAPVVERSAGNSFHLITAPVVELDGDTAYGETYFISYATVTDRDKPATRSRGGRYLDRFERRDGEWKIARRLLVDEWSRLDELPAPMAPPAGRVGLRSKDDPVYTFRAGG